VLLTCATFSGTEYHAEFPKFDAFYSDRRCIRTVYRHAPAHAQQELTNVSYDPTRELYREYSALFITH
jgi:ABC-type sulfate transport system substrate-binding protein